MIGLGLIFLSNNQSLRQSRLAESDLVFESWGPALLGRVWLFRILITLVLVTRVPATDFVKMTPDKHSLFLSFFLTVLDTSSCFLFGYRSLPYVKRSGLSKTVSFLEAHTT